MSGYIGTQPVPQATQTRDTFTATSGQTSFATSGYTPNYLDVFLNGVKLAAADYTASNGSDAVLAVGATTGDILEVVAYTTFEISGVTGLTPSITDNGNATAITIDSSENVLVGKTSADFGVTVGAELNANDTAYFTRSGGGTLTLNRLSSDGDIALFRKDGSTVGSIGATSGDMYLGTDNTGLRFVNAGSDIRPFDPSTTSIRDAAIDLGDSSARFKDLYLSGGVYLGGTGAANKLDDYEEGTWVPSVGGTATYTAFTGEYTKVGRLVTAAFDMTINAIGTGATSSILGLPFAAGGNTQGQSGSVSYWSSSATAVYYLALRVDLSATVISLSGTTSAMATANAGPTVFQNGARVIGTLTYQAS